MSRPLGSKRGRRPLPARGLQLRVLCAPLGLLLWSCGGAGRAETDLAFALPGEAFLRVGEPVTLDPGTRPVDGLVFSVDPTLPEGLTFDPATGGITGTPTESSPSGEYLIRARFDQDSLQAIVLEHRIRVAVGPELPVEVEELDPRFQVERIVALPQPPGKLAVAPDGRLFVTELMTGSVRIVSAANELVPTPFATLPVETGGHQGLLGIALSPDFGTDGLVFVTAVAPAGGGDPVRTQLWRFRDEGGVGVDATLLLDGLPAAAINNGGALLFDSGGMLLVSIGDTEQPDLAQDPASHAGKLLRVDPSDGSIPTDNPDPTSLVFASGLRNTFALGRHPVSGSLYGADNGPVSDDELNLLQPGKNYEWGSDGEGFGADTGPQLRHWEDVVVPTGLAVRVASIHGVWPGHGSDTLFLGLYDEEVVQRFELSGPASTDIDSESVFLRFAVQGFLNKPIDLQIGPAGRLFVLTSGAIFLVDRLP